MSVPYAGGYLGLGNSFTSQNRPPIGGWVELGRTTLGSANSDIAVTSLPDKRYYKILVYTVGESVSVDMSLELNADTGTNYANRWSLNGGADGTTNTQNKINLMPRANASATPKFGVYYLANLNTKEKLIVGHGVHQLAAGAGTASDRSEVAVKHAQTTNPVSTITVTTATAATFDTGSEVVVLGWDPADTHTDNFWEELASVTLGGTASEIDSGTITAKKYLWIQLALIKNSTASNFSEMQFNADTGTNYTRRINTDGSGDGTAINQTAFGTSNSGAGIYFFNFFIINNSANEKLMISHTVDEVSTGAAQAPRRIEGVFKWANTAAQITSIKWTGATNGYDAGSTVRVWGSD